MPANTTRNADTDRDTHTGDGPGDTDDSLGDGLGDADDGLGGVDAGSGLPSGLLDDANRAIIEALQRDGRRAYGAIANEVGLSEAAVRRRVQRLRENGIIQIVAVTDPLQLGFHRQAMVGIRVEGDVRQVAAKVSALEEVDYVVMCAGSFDLLAEVVCEDDDRLLHLLNDSIRSIPGIRSTETFLYLKLAKQTYTWGTR
jgi:Lrp/AsnC family transcriptional regulator for asnA, asnC and gidA